MEEAKLIFELVNRSGSTGQSTASPGGQQGKSAPTAAEQFQESTAGGVNKAIGENNPQTASKPAANVPASPAKPVTQAPSSPQQPPAAPQFTEVNASAQTPAEKPRASGEDFTRQIKDIANAVRPVTSQIPVVGGIVGNAGNLADLAAKVTPLFAPKIIEPSSRAQALREESQAEIPQFSQPVELPESPQYPRSQSAAEKAADLAASRAAAMDGAAKPVPPSPALPVSPKMAAHSVTPTATGLLATKAAGPAGAAMGAADTLSGAMRGDPDSLQTLAAGAGIGVLTAAAAGAAYKAGKSALNFVERSAADASRRLAPLSPEIAVEQAFADLRRMRANMDSASRNGEDVARYVRGSSVLDTELQKASDDWTAKFIGLLGEQKETAGRIVGLSSRAAQESPLAQMINSQLDQMIQGQNQTNRLLQRLANEPDPAEGNILFLHNRLPNPPNIFPFTGNEQDMPFAADMKFHMPGLGV